MISPPPIARMRLSTPPGRLLTISVFLGLASFAVAQENQKQVTAFGGTWLIDGSKSTPWMAQFGETKLRISLRESKITTTREFKRSDRTTAIAGAILGADPIETFVYFTDGRGEKNRSVFDPTVTRAGVRSKTTLEDGKIVVRSSRKESGSTTNTTESWELSDDGKVLTETTTTVTGLRSRISYAIFNRVQKHR